MIAFAVNTNNLEQKENLIDFFLFKNNIIEIDYIWQSPNPIVFLKNEAFLLLIQVIIGLSFIKSLERHFVFLDSIMDLRKYIYGKAQNGIIKKTSRSSQVSPIKKDDPDYINKQKEKMQEQENIQISLNKLIIYISVISIILTLFSFIIMKKIFGRSFKEVILLSIFFIIFTTQMIMMLILSYRKFCTNMSLYPHTKFTKVILCLTIIVVIVFFKFFIHYLFLLTVFSIFIGFYIFYNQIPKVKVN